MILVPVSAGELLDKITILRIKKSRLDDAAKIANVSRELELLEAVEREHLSGGPDYQALYQALYDVNNELWDVEDGKRDCERRKSFGEPFIELARKVYLRNDHRAAVKRQLNDLLGSAIVEEKSYKAY
jgi:hypothetical protein